MKSLCRKVLHSSHLNQPVNQDVSEIKGKCTDYYLKYPRHAWKFISLKNLTRKCNQLSIMKRPEDRYLDILRVHWQRHNLCNYIGVVFINYMLIWIWPTKHFQMLKMKTYLIEGVSSELERNNLCALEGLDDCTNPRTNAAAWCLSMPPYLPFT